MLPNRSGSFPPNVVLSDDPSKGRIARETPVSGTAWRSGFRFGNSILPHWVVVVIIPICLALRLFEKFCFPIHSYYIRWPLCGYGCFHVFSSFMAFMTTGRPEAGLWLAIFCYAGLAMSCFLEWVRLQRECPLTTT
jgi:hypothetical protein